MRLRRLTTKNFMPYRGVQAIEFPQGSANVVVIYGDNMRGKTSFLNAIRFAFFGRATARHLRDIERVNLVNIEAAEAGDWSLFVSVEFTHEAADYELRRDLIPMQHIVRPQRNDEFRETYTLRKNGVPLTGRDLQFEMNQVMPEGISRFFLFDGELLQEYEVLVRDPANASKIKEAVEAILGVPALTKGRSEIQSLLLSAQSAQFEELRHSRNLKAKAEQQIALQREITEQRTALAGRMEEKAALDQTAEELRLKLEQFTLALELEKELIDVVNKIEASKATSRQLVATRADFLQDAWADLIQPQLQGLRLNLEEDRDALMAALNDRARITHRAEELRRGLDEKNCPLCGSALDEEHAKHIGRELGSIEGRLAELAADVAELGAVQARLETLNRLRGPRMADRIVAAEKSLRQEAVTQAELNARAERLRIQLKEFSGPEAERIRAEREQVLTVAGSMKREIDTKRVEVGKLQRRLDQVSRLMSKNPFARRQRSSRLVTLYSALDEVFAESIDRLRDRQRKRVEDYASSAFHALTSEPDFEGLQINENYGLTILDNKGRPVNERSAGAEQIVALSLIDGLNRAGRRGGPIVMDTPFGRLDWVHRANVLRFLPNMAEQVILLVHEGEMDPQRDLPTLADRVGKMYRIRRLSARHSEIVDYEKAATA